MKEYVSPNVELITFKDEIVLQASQCSCHFDITKHDMSLSGVTCKAMSGHASENPFGISAPDWSFG